MRTFEQGDGEAWEAARAEVDAGRPALLLTDLYYLDHYGNSAHFPGHAVVLAGYDEEVALPLRHRLRGAADDAAREPRPGAPQPAPRLPARRPHVHRVRRRSPSEQLRAAIPAAIERAATAMVEPEFREFSGLGAVRRLSEEAGAWPEAAEDWQWCARFGYQVIERRGTGGGAFRLMYSRFLEEAGRPEAAPLAAEAAARWTELADAFHAASESDDPEPSRCGARSTPPPASSSRPRSGSGPRWPSASSRLAHWPRRAPGDDRRVGCEARARSRTSRPAAGRGRPPR